MVSINSHTLVALAQKVTKEVTEGDHAVLTGMFLDPSIPIDMSYPNSDFCEDIQSAVACLRKSSESNEDSRFMRSFAGYLPSFLNALEMKYGVTELRPLIFPAANGLQIKIRLKD